MAEVRISQDVGYLSESFSSGQGSEASENAMAQEDLDEWPAVMDTAEERAGVSLDSAAVLPQSTSTAMQGCRPYGDSAKSAQPRWMALQSQAPKGGSSTMSMKGKFNLMRQVSFGRLDQLLMDSPTSADAAGNQGEDHSTFGGLMEDVTSNLEKLISAVHNLEDWHKQNGIPPQRQPNSTSEVLAKTSQLRSASTDSGNSETWAPAVSTQSRGNSNMWAPATSAQSRSGARRQSETHRSSRSYGAKRPSLNLDAMRLQLRDIWQQTEDVGPSEFEVVAVQFQSRLSGQTAKLRRARTGRDMDEHRTILHPYSFFCLIWNILCILAIFYDIFAIPLQAFALPQEIDLLMRVMDWILAIFWTVDVLVSARTGFFAKQILHMDPIDILKNYSKTWLVPDLIMVGLSWFATTTDTLTRWSNVFRGRAFRTLRWMQLGRMCKISSVWRIIEDLINTNFMHLCFGLVKLTAALIIMLHIVTCAWYAIGESEAEGWTSYYHPTMDGPRTFWFWYFASCRWTLAQINGRTDIDERRTVEELYYTCAVAVLFAVIFMSIFISSITTTMVELSAAAEAETSTTRLMDEYSGYYEVPMVLVGSVKRHLRDMTFQDDQQKESKILEKLPRQLASDLLYEIHSPVLLNVHFFQELDANYPRVMRHLCSGVVSPVSVYKWEMIFDMGEPCSRMLLVRRGELNYSIEHEYGDLWTPDYQNPDAPAPPGEALHRGSWLCEAALWLEWVNRGRLIAAEQSSLLSLDAKKFANLIRDYKEAHLMASTYAKGFLETLMGVQYASDRVVMRVCSVRMSLDSDCSEAPGMDATKSTGSQVTKVWSAASKVFSGWRSSMQSEPAT